VSLGLDARIRGRFVRRYKRFFVEVETPGGETLTVHCADTGSMRGFQRPGAAVRCSESADPRRKLRYTLEMMRIGRIWVGLHPGRANPLVARALAKGTLRELAGYAELQREVSVGDSRLDFRLSGRRRDRRPAYVEVKSVTLAESGVGLFPDSVTERGRRHLAELSRLRRRGARAALIYLVQRADCVAVAPAEAIDPAYAAALRDAARDGVELYALGARVTGQRLRVERRLPVRL
jgi:sugar fermentation stimulation protein A